MLSPRCKQTYQVFVPRIVYLLFMDENGGGGDCASLICFSAYKGKKQIQVGTATAKPWLASFLSRAHVLGWFYEITPTKLEQLPVGWSQCLLYNKLSLPLSVYSIQRGMEAFIRVSTIYCSLRVWKVKSKTTIISNLIVYLVHLVLIMMKSCSQKLWDDYSV